MMFKIFVTSLLLFFSSGLLAQNIHFKQISTAQGLSQGTVNCIFKDKQGFIWVGTNDGLNKYDGYKFSVYRHDFQDSTTLSSNKIYDIEEDEKGNLWIATRSGLNVLLRKTNTFVRYLADEKSPNGLNHNFIRTLFKDQNDHIWIGTLGGGLFRFSGGDPAKANFDKIKPRMPSKNSLKSPIVNITSISQSTSGTLLVGSHRPEILELDPVSLKADVISLKNLGHSIDGLGKTIFEDKDGELWMLTEGNGFLIYNPASGIHNLYNKDNLKALSSNIIKDIHEEGDEYWLATDGGGIVIFDKKSQKAKAYQYDIRDSQSISSNGVYCIFKDQQEIFWIGTFDGGINVFNTNWKKFYHFTQEIGNLHSLSHKSVLSFLQDHKGRIWVGTDGGGLNLFNKQTGKFTHFQSGQKNSNGLTSNVITSIYQDELNRVWVGTYAGGLHLFDPEKGKFSQQSIFKEAAIKNIWAIYQHDEKLWLGSSSGLYTYDFVTKQLEQVPSFNKKANAYLGRVLTIFKDSNEIIWTGGTSLNYFDDKSGLLKPLSIQKEKFWGNYDIRCITEDINGNLWVGTEGGGLVKIDKNRKTFNVYGTSDGLPNNSVHQILINNQGKLWLSTNEGLASFDRETEDVFTFDENDGLQGNQFSYSAAMKATDGTMYFGGNNGFNYFQPEQIKFNQYIPNVVLTDFLISNKPVPIDPKGKNSPLLKHISLTDSITLAYDQASITIAYTALNFTSSSKNLYAYYLQGFENAWNDPTNNRSATYTNLEPGEYLFKVKAANNDEVWNPEYESLYIKVLPPFWKTIWAYIIYGVILLIIIISFRKYLLDKAQYKHELKIQEFEKDKIEKVNQMKLSFFTNISHEFRTPLTLILNPLENMLAKEKLNCNVKNQLEIMQRNGHRLLNLINQLMDFRKLEHSNITLKKEKGDIVLFLKQIKAAFDEFARQHNILFKFRSNLSSFYCYYDKDKLEIIFYNLLSNAFKFTRDGGHIFFELLVSEDGQSMQINVEDDGIGIPQERLPKIFDRFYKIPNSDRLIENLKQKGTGIGLSLSKELVELHQGTLEVVSELSKGSCFSVRLPVWQENQIEEDKLFANHVPIDQNDLFEQLTMDNDLVEELLPSDNKQKSRMLIVEDNLDLRQFLLSVFKDRYSIIMAKNGVEGYKAARNEVPDIIITDVMMPEMDGFELCQRLKKDDITCHIPIIILTAKNSLNANIHSFDIGADAFVPKPFSTKLLNSRVTNLILSRKNLREQFKKEFLDPSPVKIKSADDNFLLKAMAILEKKLSDSSFSVDDFATEMGLSRSVFYRKMRAIADQSVNEFINSARLKFAAKLLQQKKLSITEITYHIGFSDPQYFSKCFKKFYGCTPSEYAHNQQDINELSDMK